MRRINQIRMAAVLLGIVLAFGIGTIFLHHADKTTEASIKVVGFHEAEGNIYYNDENGQTVTGWKEIGGDTFYFDASGIMATGDRTIDGEEYSFASDGKLQATDRDRMDDKAKELASDTEYLILVNCKTHKVGIYEGAQGEWSRLQYWDCSDGRPGHETPRDTYKMGTVNTNYYHFKYFDSEGGRLWYATKIWGPYLFHSVPYEIASSPETIQDPTIGESVSKGCIRLEIENAKWIYENIPKGTYCEIYDE
ncbi:MAG: L,D-transpeptidase family protein [Firmicutes bacterium]|nr:L,D-transpeptidase family protein [Bacillota bacterium]